MFDALTHDLAYAVRQLRRSPMFTAVAIVSLAIGMAGAAAIFSITDALFLRARPGIANPASLADVGRSQDGDGFDNLSFPNYVDLRERNTVFSGLAAMRVTPEALGLGDADGADRVFGLPVSANYFDVLQVPMSAGRGFRPEEERDATPFVTVLSHGLWTSRFNADPAILGTTIRVNGRPFTVVGVAAPGFTGTNVFATDLWVPIGSFPALSGNTGLLQLRAGVWLQSIGRLREGVTIAQAQAAMAVLGQTLEREFPQDNAGKGVVVTSYAPLPPPARTAVAAFVGLLFVLMVLVLLIACSNVAGMLLARGVERGREVGIRLALGAGARRIVRQLLVESGLLSLAGAMVGTLASLWIIQALQAIPVVQLVGFPMAVDFHLDWRLVLFSGVLAVGTGLLFGLAPAVHTIRTALTPIQSDASTYTPARLRWRQGFLVAQIAMSVLLVVVAGLFVRSLRYAGTVEPGFTTDGVEIVGLDMRLAGHSRETGQAFATRLLERVRLIPNVESAAYARVLPLTGGGLGLGRLQVPGRNADDRSLDRTDWNIVSGAYFDAMRMPLVSGRTFEDGDVLNGVHVAIVNETLAARAWPGEEPLGKTLRQEGPPGSPIPPQTLQIVGVVRNARYRSLGDADRLFIFVPYTQQYMADLTLVLRRGTAASVVPAVRAAVSELDPNLPVIRATTLESVTAAGLLPNRVAAWLSGATGVVGVMLAAVGIYGLMAFSVSQRRRELGVRMALGAERRSVLLLIMRQAVTLAAIGAVLGLAAAGVGSRLLTSLLFGLKPLDVVSFALGGATFLAVALLASLVPAHRAASTNPVDALHAE